MNKEKIKRFVLIVKERFTGGEVHSVSVLISFYLLLSLFPLLIALGNLLPLLNIDVDSVFLYLGTVVPEAVMPVLEPIIRGLLTDTSGGLLSVGLVAAIWSSSRGVNYLQQGMNKVYGIPNNASFIAKKLVSVFTIVLILLLLVVFVLVFSFGDMLLTSLEPIFPWAGTLDRLIKDWKWPVTLVFLFGIMIIVYRVTPDVRLRIRDTLPGAALATVGLMALVQLFSIYLQFATRRFSSYGTLGAFFVLMFWLQFSCILVLAGAVLNASIGEYRFGKAQPLYSGVDNAIDTTKRTLLGWLKGLFQRKRNKPRG